MRRTTIFVEEQLQRELQALARRQGRPMAGLVREAVEQYVVAARARASTRGFVALGRSGRHDVADRHEELLFEDGPERRSPAPGQSKGRGRRRTPAQPGGTPRRRSR